MTVNATSIESMRVLGKPHLHISRSLQPPRGWYVTGKTLVDWVLAVLLLLPIAIVVGFLAFLVRAESRPGILQAAASRPRGIGLLDPQVALDEAQLRG